MYLRTLTNAELLRIADHQFNAISGTDLERELITRLQAADEAFTANEPLLDVLAELDVDKPDDLRARLEVFGNQSPAQVKALLDALADFDDAYALRKRLERADEFDQAMEDPAAFIATLSTTTE